MMGVFGEKTDIAESLLFTSLVKRDFIVSSFIYKVANQGNGFESICVGICLSELSEFILDVLVLLTRKDTAYFQYGHGTINYITVVVPLYY